MEVFFNILLYKNTSPKYRDFFFPFFESYLKYNAFIDMI